MSEAQQNESPSQNATVPKREFTAAESFAFYASLFKAQPFSEEEVETLKPGLQERGFSPGSDVDVPRELGIAWLMGDGSGTTTIWWSEDTVEVTYTPSEPVQVGDSALAGLICKAANVHLENGDEIIVAIREPNLSPLRRVWEGNGHTEQLKFSLRGGMWKETVVSVSWPAAGQTRRALTIAVIAVGVFLCALNVIVEFIHWSWNSSL